MGIKKIKVERGVAVPDQRERVSKYPLKDMSVGESFLVDKPTIRPYLSKFQQEDPEGRRFVTRKTHGGYRVWRVE